MDLGMVTQELVSTKPRIAFLYATFPRQTETFVRRELRALWDLGLNIEPFSIWRGEDCFGGREVRLFCMWELLTLVFWLPYWMTFRPRGFCEILSELWKRPCPSLQNWNETFLALGYAVVRAKEFEREGYSLSHAVWATMPATAAIALKKLVGIDFSMGAHAYDVFRRQGDWLLECKLGEAAFVRTTSESSQQRLLELGLSPSRLRLVRRGLANWPESRALSGFCKPLEILTVGRLVPKKGYPDLLVILNRLKEARVSFRARIVGAGPLEETLKLERDRFDLSDQVHFLGGLSESETFALYAESDLFLFSGRVASDGDRDGIPNVIPEAMAAGLVVITSSSGGAAEAVEDGETGFVLSPSQPDDWVSLILQLLASPERVAGLRKAAITRAQDNFDVRRTARELKSHLLEACSEE